MAPVMGRRNRGAPITARDMLTACVEETRPTQGAFMFENIETSPELLALLKRAAGHKMSPEQRFEQRVSFVYGQQDFDDPKPRSKDEIRRHLAEIYGAPPR
jgi:hypothetical protein